MKKLLSTVLITLTIGCNSLKTDIRTVKITEKNKAEIIQKILNYEAHLTDDETTAIKSYIGFKQMQSIGFGGSPRPSLPVGKTLNEVVTIANQYQKLKAELDRSDEAFTNLNEDFKKWKDADLTGPDGTMTTKEYEKKLKEYQEQLHTVLEQSSKLRKEIEKF